MSIWYGNPTVEMIEHWQQDTMSTHLGIEFTEIGDDFLKAKMPITNKSVQPYRTMHGGASATLAETIGSVAAVLTVDGTQKRCMGLALNVNHIRPVPEGKMVYATARPQHIGRTTQVWGIEVQDERAKLTTTATLTIAVVEVNGGSIPLPQ